MKKTKFISLVALLSFGSLFLMNCGPGENVDPKPVLEFIGGTEYVSGDISLPGSTEFKVGINASHTTRIESMQITVSYDGGVESIPTNCSLCDTVIDASSIRVDYVGETRATEGTEVWSFIVSDADGNTTKKSITITNIGSGGESLIEITQDNSGDPLRVWNFKGPNSGAYDLVVGGNLLSSDDDASKDIQDSTANSEIANWPARWTSRNATVFKEVSGYAWGTVTNTAQLQAAWDESGAETKTIDMVDGNYYIAKLRGTDDLIFIEVTDVNSTSSDNLDYVQFRYKKAP
jgi:hypothetical protein